MILLALLPASLGAEVTHIPPFLRGDLKVSYDADVQFANLEEDDVAVGSYLHESHKVIYDLAFGAAPGLALSMSIPTYPREALSYTDAQQMIYEPTLETGTLASGPLMDEDPSYLGKGSGGMWLGLRGTPLGDQIFPGRAQNTTWLLELAWRLKDDSHFWAEDADGVRGAGPGAPAFKFRTAFSTERDQKRPYLEGTLIRNKTIDVQLEESSGGEAPELVTLEPSDMTQIRSGIEFYAFEDPEADKLVSIDLRFGWRYQTFATLPSGLFLPSVLPTTMDQSTVRSEFSDYSLGLGVYFQPFTYMKFDLWADAGYRTPHQMEQSYEVNLAGANMLVEGGLEMEILIR